MNYEKIYENIVKNAKSQLRDKKVSYYENHHIIPRCFGGSNKAVNMVLLTAKEHFICHVLLVRINKNDSNKFKKMLHALMYFKGANDNQKRYINSRLYQSLKIEYSKIRSIARKDVPLTEEHKKKIGSSMKGKKPSDETKAKIAEKARNRKRKPFSDEYKKRHSEIMKSKKAALADVVIAGA